MVSFKPRPLYLMWLGGCQTPSGSLGEENFAGNRAPIPSPSSSSKSEGFPLSLLRKKTEKFRIIGSPKACWIRADSATRHALHVTAVTRDCRHIWGKELQVGMFKVHVHWHTVCACCAVLWIAYYCIFFWGGGGLGLLKKSENGLRRRWPDFVTRWYILKTENISRSTNVSWLRPQAQACKQQNNIKHVQVRLCCLLKALFPL